MTSSKQSTQLETIRNYRWTDFAENGVQNRNNIVDFFRTYGESFQGKPLVDAYCGLFAFDETFKQYVEAHGSVTGYKGKHFPHLFVLDVDSPDGDAEEAMSATAKIVDWLLAEALTEEQFFVFFSGKKGFHICLPHTLFGYSPSETMSKDCRRLARLIAQKTNVPCTGDSTKIDLIYDTTRLLRLPNSLHPDSGLYKIQIHPKDVFSDNVQHILEQAKRPREHPLYRFNQQGDGVLNSLWTESLLQSFTERPSDDLVARPDFAYNSGEESIKNAKICIARLMRGVGQSKRNKSAIRLADHYRKQGLGIDVVESILKTWNMKNSPPLPAEELSRTVRSAFSNTMDFGCYDEILAENCSSRCFLFSKISRGESEGDTLITDTNFKTKKQVIEEYVDRMVQEDGIHLGIRELDLYVKLHKGHVVQYMAKAGGGKTAFAMHCMNNLSQSGKKSLFLSLEMTGADVAERAYQMSAVKTSVQLERTIVDLINQKRGKEEIVETIAKETGASFENVYIVDEDSASIDKIEQYVFKAKQKFGIDAVFIDYLSRISQDSSSSYEHISAVAKGLKTMAKRHNVIVFYLHQVNRSVENSETAVMMNAGRDSGQTEEAADVILSSWRPGASQGDNEFVIRVLKNRRGRANIDIKLDFRPDIMQFVQPGDPQPRKQYGQPTTF